MTTEPNTGDVHKRDGVTGAFRPHQRRAGPAADPTITLSIGLTGGIRLSTGAVQALGTPQRVRVGDTDVPPSKDGTMDALSARALVVMATDEGDPNSYRLQQPNLRAPRSGIFTARAFLRDLGVRLGHERYNLRGWLQEYPEGPGLVFPLPQKALHGAQPALGLPAAQQPAMGRAAPLGGSTSTDTPHPKPTSRGQWEDISLHDETESTRRGEHQSGTP